jgi:hypothetical protein
MRKKLVQISIGIIVVALLATVTLLPFIFGRNPGTGTHAADGKDEGRSLTSFTVTPEETASKTVKVTPTMQSLTPTSTIGLLTPSPTPTEILYTGKAALGSFQYGGVGVTIRIYGYSFLPGEHVAVYWNYQHQGQFELSTPIADGGGNFTYVTAAPSDPNLGKGYIAGIGLTSHYLATTTVSLTPGVAPVPYEVIVGNGIQVSGGGFDAGEQVTLLVEGMKIGTVTTDYRGGFQTSVVIPSSAPPGAGSNVLEAIGQTSGLKVFASYFVVYFNYPISVSPASGPAYTTVTITGSKFTPNGTIWISWGENGGAPPALGTAIASSTGTFTVTVKVLPCPTPTCSIAIWDNTAQRGAMTIPFPET